MKILDRYIIRELLAPVIFCSISLVALVLIADVFDNLDEMLKNKTEANFILGYYLNLIPMAFSQTINWATLLGTIYLLFNYNRYNEILAMKAAGMNIETIMIPLLYVGLMIGIVTFFVNDQVVPRTFLLARDIKVSQIEKNTIKEDGLTLYDVTYFSPDNEIFYIRSLNTVKKQMKNMVVVFLNPEKRAERKLIAREANWDGNVWKLKQVTSYNMNDQGRMLSDPQVLTEKDFTETKVTPTELIETSREGVFLSYKELKNQIRKLKEHQFKLNTEEVELSNKLAAPWHNLIMILIAVPLLSGTAKRKMFAVNLLKCFGVVLAFHFVTAISLALGKSGVFWPPLAAWLSTFIFGATTIFYLDHGNR